MGKTDILNLVWMPLVTDSNCLWQGSGHVTWKTGLSLECTVQMCISNQECAHALPPDKRKLHLSAFPSATLMPLQLLQAWQAEQRTPLGASALPQCQDHKWKGSERETERGKAGSDKHSSQWCLGEHFNLWVRPVEDLRVLCESRNYNSSLVTPALQMVLDGNTGGAERKSRYQVHGLDWLA